MTRVPAASTLPTPTWVQDDNANVQTVLTAAWLHNEYDLALTIADPVVSILPPDVAARGMKQVAESLELAARVESCTFRAELEGLTGLPWPGPLADNIAEMAAAFRDTAREQAAQLIDQADTARWSIA